MDAIRKAKRESRCEKKFRGINVQKGTQNRGHEETIEWGDIMGCSGKGHGVSKHRPCFIG